MNLTQIVLLMREVAKRGFLSEPQPNWLNKDEEDYYISWLPEESQSMREFLANNQYLSKMGRRKISSMFGESESTTVSLLGRISYAMSGKHISPEYVSALATELEESQHEYSALYEQVELEKML